MCMCLGKIQEGVLAQMIRGNLLVIEVLMKGRTQLNRDVG